jgi:hypothetical protein
MSDLIPCPFCGGHAEIFGDELCYAECLDCGAGYSVKYEYDNDEDSDVDK